MRNIYFIRRTDAFVLVYLYDSMNGTLPALSITNEIHAQVNSLSRQCVGVEYLNAYNDSWFTGYEFSPLAYSILKAWFTVRGWNEIQESDAWLTKSC